MKRTEGTVKSQSLANKRNQPELMSKTPWRGPILLAWLQPLVSLSRIPEQSGGFALRFPNLEARDSLTRQPRPSLDENVVPRAQLAPFKCAD